MTADKFVGHSGIAVRPSASQPGSETLLLSFQSLAINECLATDRGEYMNE